MKKRALVVTTINAPNKALYALAEGARRHNRAFYVTGDAKSPTEFELPPATYSSLAQQEAAFPDLCAVLPKGHYTRKNVGYLEAIRDGADEIQETDDDNIPREEFWDFRTDAEEFEAVHSERAWVNAYGLFSSENVWPRGYPLQELNRRNQLTFTRQKAPRALIFQGLADENPDVDAVYRLTRQLPLSFDYRDPILLPRSVWSPFNSQNTIFTRDTFPLLYLPSRCSFRMTDIWRSYVAQRCLWEAGGAVVFHAATVYQERNEHDLLRDFEDEVPGYLLNDRIRLSLEKQTLAADDMLHNLTRCYEALVEDQLIPADELPILQAWCRSVEPFL